MRNKLFLVLIAFCGGLAAATIPDDISGTQATLLVDMPGIFSRLKSEDESERHSAFRALNRLHNDINSQLRNIASAPKPKYQPNDSRTLAAKLLPKFNSPEVIPTLIQNVEYQAPGEMINEYSALNAFTCAQGLRSLGQQAATTGIVEYLWKTPTEQVSDKQIDLFAHIFSNVYGAPGAVGGGPKECIAVIERARDRAFGQRAKDNCQRLLDRVKEIVPDFILEELEAEKKGS